MLLVMPSENSLREVVNKDFKPVANEKLTSENDK